MTDEPPPDPIGYDTYYAEAYVDALRERIAALEGENARLREHALDLSAVPEGWEFASLTSGGPGVLHLRLEKQSIFVVAHGVGPTPAAALADAIERVRG